MSLEPGKEISQNKWIMLTFAQAKNHTIKDLVEKKRRKSFHMRK